jgi:hypothetical protein
MQSTADTVAEYLRELPGDRRKVIRTVRAVIRKHLPKGYEEGMIAYQVPLRAYPGTYNGQPLLCAALASQKHHMALYLSGIYASPTARRRFEKAYRTTGKRFDVGKSCVRFRMLDDLPLPLVATTIASLDTRTLIAFTERAGSSRPGAP